MNFWENKRVLVTGGYGFLGSHVVERLMQHGCKTIITFHSNDYDLTSTLQVDQLLLETFPHIVIHLAAKVGGIGANSKYPSEFFFENMAMGMNMLDRSFNFGIEKFVMIGTVCSYPKNTPVPFREEDLWNGYPEETNAPYGIAKKALMVYGQALKREFGFNVINLIPTNLYGPRDNFDLETSHVIPAMIRKIKEREGNQVTLWGTGMATRDFLYVEDAAEAIVLATEHYNKSEPINLGSGKEIIMRDLAKEIHFAFESLHRTVYAMPNIVWDITKPDGQPRRCLETSKAKQEFGWEAKTPLYEGLRKTIEWYDKVMEGQ